MQQAHNLGSDRRPFLVEFAANPVFDLLIALWTCRSSDPKRETFDMGEDWFSEFDDAIPADLRTELEELGGSSLHKISWLLTGLLAERASLGPEVDEALDWIRSEAYESLRDELLWRTSGQESAAMAADDPSAIDTAVQRYAQENDAEHVEAFRNFLVDPPADYNNRLADALVRLRESAYAGYEQRYAQAVQRSASSVALIVPGSQPQELIERITNGIDFQIPLGTTRIVLVPSVLIRPWAMVHETGSSIVVVYPVSEENLNADPDAPPSWLVAYHKALGDSKRLKILRRLANGPADLSDLAEMLGMAKSSTFHHIGVLRSAGLVRVHIGGSDDHYYDLRTQAFDDAAGLLDKYLETSLTEGDYT